MSCGRTTACGDAIIYLRLTLEGDTACKRPTGHARTPAGEQAFQAGQTRRPSPCPARACPEERRPQVGRQPHASRFPTGWVDMCP